MYRIQKLQNCSLRVVYSLRRNDHVSAFQKAAANILQIEAVCGVQTRWLDHRVLTLKERHYVLDRLQLRGRSPVAAPVIRWSTTLPKDQAEVIYVNDYKSIISL